MQDRKFHFISGLPRSGSTLLSAVLRQNPLFHAGISSPVAGLIEATKSMMSGNPEFDVQISIEQRTRILRSIMLEYYGDVAEPVVFDTSRFWTGRIHEIQAYFPTAKTIAMVRNPAWILDSLERITRKNPLISSKISGPRAGGGIDMRLGNYTAPQGIVGGPLAALKEGLFGEQSNEILLIEYDCLCANPTAILRAIYDFLEEEWFEHDFDNLTFNSDSFDEILNTPGLHNISGPVKKIDRDTVLSPDLFAKYSRDMFWHGDIPTKAKRIIMK
jgi:sulfotransferase